MDIALLYYLYVKRHHLEYHRTGAVRTADYHSLVSRALTAFSGSADGQRGIDMCPHRIPRLRAELTAELIIIASVNREFLTTLELCAWSGFRIIKITAL